MPWMRDWAPLRREAGLDADFAAGPDRPGAWRLSAAFGWPAAAAAIVLAGLAFLYVFRHDAAAAVRVWMGSTAYNHCFLILPLIGYLLWERRAVFRVVSPRPVLWPLAALPLLSAGWLLCAVIDLNEGRQLLVTAMFVVTILSVLGPQATRALLAPVLFLFFLVPTGEFLVPWLQRVTADIAVYGLQLFHIPVYSDGTMIEIPEGRFEIAEACAGLRFLIASIVFGCFFAVLMYRSYWRRLLFIALSLSVPIGANGLRALGIIALAHLEGSATAVEADHVLYGWLFFSLVILLLTAIGMTFADTRRAAPAPPAVPVTRSPPLWRLAVAPALAVALAAAGPVYAARLEARAAAASLPPLHADQIAPPWQATAAVGIGWRPVVVAAGRELLHAFAEPGAPAVVEFMALYPPRVIGNPLTNSDNRIADEKTWQLVRQDRAAVSIAGRQETVNVAHIMSGPRRRLVWSFYVVDGKITAGRRTAKFLQARAVLLDQARRVAFVAASADDSGLDAERQLRQFFAARAATLGRLRTLSGGIAGAVSAK